MNSQTHTQTPSGTGSGSSVLQVVKSMEKACGHKVPYKIAPRRPGDLAIVFANPDKARDVLKWKATRDMDKMCEDSWRWQSTNPQGFGGSVPSTKMWLRLVNYAMAKKMKMWDVLQTTYLTGCKEKSKAHEAFELAAQNTSDEYARGPCVAALDAVQIPDRTKSETIITNWDCKESVPQFQEWKKSRLCVAKSQL